LNIVFSTIYYPVAIGKYFDAALRRRDDVNIFSVGPWTSTWIPWKGGIHIDEKYSQPPDIPISKSLIGNVLLNPKAVEHQIPFKPDLWINVDAGFGFSKPDCPYAVVATDPHVLQYTYQRAQADIFYNMQDYYAIGGDRVLPYCADPVWHAPLSMEKEYDVCLIGLQYENRNQLVNKLRDKGLKVYYDTGPCYTEYQELYAKSRVALSWSSKRDLIARVFEGMHMAIPVVCNRVQSMSTYFVEGEHYLGFGNAEQIGDEWSQSDISEAVEQVEKILADYDAAIEMALAAHNKVAAQHLYDYRISTILRDFKLI